MKKSIILALLVLPIMLFGQTKFVPTSDVLTGTSEMVYDVNYGKSKIGEFIPVKTLEFITNQTDRDLFNGTNLKEVLAKTKGVAIVPGTMTNKTGTTEGSALSKGRTCGDGTLQDWGILIIENGEIEFTHSRELGSNFNPRYREVMLSGGDLIQMISIYRWSEKDQEIKKSTSSKPVSKLLVRRETYAGVQIGVVILSRALQAKDAVKVLQGMDRNGASKTTHAFVLDGLGDYDQYAKSVNGQTIVLGHRDPNKVTNYFVLR